MKLNVNLWELFLLFLAILNIGTFHIIVTEILEDLLGGVITALLLCGGLAYCKIKIYKERKNIYIKNIKDFLWGKEVTVDINELQKYKKEYMNGFPIITDDNNITCDINKHGGPYDI